IRIDVVIDAHIELVAVDVISVSYIEVHSADSPREANSRSIQPVADSVVVRKGHSCKQYILDETARIVSRPVRISRPAVVIEENIERLQTACGGCRSDGIAIPIDGRSVLRRILAVCPRKVTEDALTRQRRQNRSDERLFENIALFIDEREEKRFVLDDW